MKRKTKPLIAYNPEFENERGHRLRWVENASDGLRVCGEAHEFAPNSLALGYYLHPIFQDETVSGAVLQLPARNGKARFVPAITDPFNDDCYLVEFGDVYECPGDDPDDAKADAAIAADALAEHYAEVERDYQTLEGAKQAIEDARERIREERQAAHVLALEMRAFANWRNDAAPAICKTLHNEMKRRRAAVSAAVKRIRQLTRNPFDWLEAAR